MELTEELLKCRAEIMACDDGIESGHCALLRRAAAALKLSEDVNVELRERIQELRTALGRAVEALSRCYDVTEWPAEDGSFQLTVLNEIKPLMAHSE